MLDENTGLPVSPEGCFWRVAPGDGVVWMKLMRRRKFLLSKLLKQRGIYTRDDEPVEKSIQRAARVILEDLSDADRLHAFIGDYPPHSLVKRDE